MIHTPAAQSLVVASAYIKGLAKPASGCKRFQAKRTMTIVKYVDAFSPVWTEEDYSPMNM